MRFIWLQITFLAFLFRKALPRPVGDTSKTLTRYAFALLDRISAPQGSISPKKRQGFFKRYASAFREDVSVERLYHALVKRATLADAALDFEVMADTMIGSRPTISMFLRLNKEITLLRFEDPDAELVSRHMSMIARYLRKGLSGDNRGTLYEMYESALASNRQKLEATLSGGTNHAKGSQHIIPANQSPNPKHPRHDKPYEPKLTIINFERLKRRRASAYLRDLNLVAGSNETKRRPYKSTDKNDKQTTAQESLTLRDLSFRKVSLFHDQFDQSIIPKIRYGEYRGKAAMIYLGSAEAASLDPSIFFDQEIVHIVADRGDLAEEALKHFRKYLKANVIVKTSVLIADGCPAYSDHEKNVVSVCDLLGNQFVQSLTKHRVVSRRLTKGLGDCLSLLVSDTLYRPVQKHYSLINLLKKSNADALFMVGEMTSAIVDASRERDVYIIDKPAATRVIIRNLRLLSAEKLGPGNRQLFRNILKRSPARLTQILSTQKNKNDKPKLLLICNTRAKSYRVAAIETTKELSNQFDIHVIDFAPHDIKKIPHACTYTALGPEFTKPKDPHWVDAEEHLAELFKTISVSDLSSEIGFEGLLASSHRPLTRLLTGTIPHMVHLHAEIGAKFKALPGDYAMLCLPGRQAEIRSLINAFNEIGRPTHDLQALFISDSPRYRAPIAKRCAVIDEHACDLYSQLFDISRENIDIVGSVILDTENAECDQIDKKLVTNELFPDIDVEKKVITFASQPLDDAVLRATLNEVCRVVASQPDLALQIKLHPGQGDDILMMHQEVANLHFSNNEKDRIAIRRDYPFSKSLAASDLLITFFSNAALLAAIRSVPVITLPVENFKAPIELDKIGVSFGIQDLSELRSAIARLLTREDHRADDLPPALYLKNNSHMSDRGTLMRLSLSIKTAIKELKQSSKTRAMS